MSEGGHAVAVLTSEGAIHANEPASVEVSAAYDRRRALRLFQKIMIAAALAAHVAVIALNNLPMSPFVAPLFEKYKLYLIVTRQTQHWLMYQYPLHGDELLSLEAAFADGGKDTPWGDATTMNSHRRYFLEAMLLSGKDTDMDNFLVNVRNRYPEDRRPTTMHIAMRRNLLPSFQEIVSKGEIPQPDWKTTREHKRTWP